MEWTAATLAASSSESLRRDRQVPFETEEFLMDVNVTRRRSLGASGAPPDATSTLLLDFLRGLHSSD